MTCRNPYDNSESVELLTEGIKGDWKAMKSNGLFSYAAMARDDNSDTDNTALNGLIMYTKNFACKD